MSKIARQLERQLRALADPERKAVQQRFFKTGPGEYAEGDVFLGVTVPVLRKLAKQYEEATLEEVEVILHSAFHECRFIAVVIMVKQFQRADARTRKQIYELYRRSSPWINNWDLVDVSAEHIIGAYLGRKSGVVLRSMARSENLWERRMAIIATFYSIKLGHPEPTLTIAKLLLDDKHDLIHKAVGWMLREVGKRCSVLAEEAFLELYAHRMPRIMLRYAIERLPPSRKSYFMKRRSVS